MELIKYKKKYNYFFSVRVTSELYKWNIAGYVRKLNYELMEGN